MRVLILAYDFPPFVSVGGLRPYSWYRYLGEFGVEPVVVTRQWANDYGDERDFVAPSAHDDVEVERSGRGTIIRAPYRPNLSNRLLLRHGPQRHRVIRKLVTAWYEVAQYYADAGPKAPLAHAAREFLRGQRVDAIVATGNPYVLFRYASDLSREFRIPWVADFRDPWSQDRRRHLYRLSNTWTRALERQHVASAAAITTVADSVRDLLGQIHTGKRIVVIPNGYDPEAMAAADGVEQRRDGLTLAYTGSTYGWHPMESVLRELDRFNRENPRTPISLRMIGVSGRGEMEELVRSRFPALAPRVAFTDRLPNERMAVELAGAHAFLMFNNYAYPGTKIFDYLALRRQILLCYSDDAEADRLKREHYNVDIPPGTDERMLEDIVRSTRSGIVVRDAGHLRGILAELQREYARTGAVACDSHGVEQYSRRAAAGRLAALLREVAP